MKKRILIIAGIVLIVVMGITIYNTARFRSLQMNVTAAQLIDVDEARAVECFAGAIPHKTISYQNRELVEKQEFLNFHRYLEESFPLVHQTMSREVVAELSLLYLWRGSDVSLKPILFMAHQDVVPIEQGTEGDWTYPPFSGAVAGGFVWGRGTMDVKVGITASLEAAELLLKSGFSPRRTIYFAYGHDEEVGGQEGTAAIVERLQSRGVELEFVLDEGGIIYDGAAMGLSQPVALIGVAEKGYLSLELSVQDQGGHSSMPPEHTSVGLLCEAVNRLEKNQRPARISGATELMFQYLGPEMPLLQRYFLANKQLFGPLLAKILSANPETASLLRTTTAATMFHAGVKDNVIPQQATAVVNFRIMPGETVEDVIEHVCSTIKNSDISIRPLDTPKNPSPVSDISEGAFSILHQTIKEVFPDVLVSPYLVIGGTDSRFYYPVCDCVYRFLGLRLYEGDFEREHGTDERQHIGDYIKYIQFLAHLMQNSREM